MSPIYLPAVCQADVGSATSSVPSRTNVPPSAVRAVNPSPRKSAASTRVNIRLSLSSTVTPWAGPNESAWKNKSHESAPHTAERVMKIQAEVGSVESDCIVTFLATKKVNSVTTIAITIPRIVVTTCAGTSAKPIFAKIVPRDAATAPKSARRTQLFSIVMWSNKLLFYGP